MDVFGLCSVWVNRPIQLERILDHGIRRGKIRMSEIHKLVILDAFEKAEGMH
jgi:hypothetical protein